MKNKRTIIRNDTLAIAIDSHGAELRSIVEQSTGIEYLWQADPAYWGRSAPILFPIVGMLKDNRYIVDGVDYNLPQHGFARDRDFQLVAKSETSATFELKENENTLKSYPFLFKLRAAFTLNENSVQVSYRVENTNSKPLLFSIGSHPAFNIPFDGGDLKDYFIEFEQAEPGEAGLPVDGLQSETSTRPFVDNRIIQLGPSLFNEGAFIFKRCLSQTIFLKSAKSQRQIAVGTGGAPYLGIWSKPDGAPFVCIEPWFGIADRADSSHDFENKEGIISLAPGSGFDAHYSIDIIS